MICMKTLRFSSRLKAKVRRRGPPGSDRAQPSSSIKIIVPTFLVIKSTMKLSGGVDFFENTPKNVKLNRPRPRV